LIPKKLLKSLMHKQMDVMGVYFWHLRRITQIYTCYSLVFELTKNRKKEVTKHKVKDLTKISFGVPMIKIVVEIKPPRPEDRQFIS